MTVMTGKNERGLSFGKRVPGRRWKAFLAAALCFALLLMPVMPIGAAKALAADELTVTLDIPFTLELTDAAASQDKTYSFEITAEDGAPIPEDMATVVQMSEAGGAQFGTLKYTEEGVYVYTIKQTTAEEENFILDDTVYKVTVGIGPTDEDDLALLYMVVNGNKTEKPQEICFKNDYSETETVTPHEDPEEPETVTPDEPSTDTQKPHSPEKKPAKATGTRTGDYVRLALPFIALAGAAAIMIWLIATRRKREQE